MPWWRAIRSRHTTIFVSDRASETRREARVFASWFALFSLTTHSHLRSCAYRTSANHFFRSHRASRFALCIALRASHVTSRSALYCACFMQTRAPDSRRHLRRKSIVPATGFFVMYDDVSSSSSPSHHFHSHKLVRVPLVCGVPAEVRAELARRLSVVASSDARCVAHAGKCCLCERLSSPELDEDDDGAILAIALDRPWALVGAALCKTDTKG